MNESYKTTLIKIMGEEYPIKSNADSEHIKKLARYVEEQIMDISAKIKLPPHLKPEVLAALVIADEYFSEKQKNAEIDQKLNKLMLVLGENFL
jgi:cell division protein ZapA (FtsZ GTPase activity inhibitor)